MKLTLKKSTYLMTKKGVNVDRYYQTIPFCFKEFMNRALHADVMIDTL